jgi:hypothetical protein
MMLFLGKFRGHRRDTRVRGINCKRGGEGRNPLNAGSCLWRSIAHVRQGDRPHNFE